ncbi:amino acid adenylation domain-containing protein [Streptomyces europaeiscabiei]|uniref:non-ribosomal peptide synthetase n=1 Tax=Streptomyces europaeiscabiei TaxID=146819 RepID=UPI0029A00443|nr:amino acid adenylation domain-containing protein [Streptomyces europaeiscabiei]MDX3691330.1 amino acid adenylation domain-containing protein [Streptomyces europaeiscabiei]
MDRSGTELTSPSWEGFRLSRQQEHVLGLASGGVASRTVAGVHLAGPLEREVLELAAHDVASVHESLRTAYRKVLGENSAVLMVIEDEPRIRVSEGSGDDAALAALVREARHTDLDECVVELVLFTHTDGRWSLVLSAPRMSMDGASVEIFFRDLRQAYAARRDGKPWDREVATQYADYAQWQFEEAVPTKQHKEIVAARQTRLAALPPRHLPLELRSGETAHEDLTWTIPAPLGQDLRSLASEYDAGLRTVLLTGWLAALWHATGRPASLAVDTMLTRRPFRELDTTIGLFESPLPVFADIADETTLSDLLRAVDQELGSFEQADESSVVPPKQHVAALPGFTFSDVVRLDSPDAPAFSGLWIEPSDDARKVGLRVQGTGEEIRLTLRHQAKGMAEGGAEAIMTCLRATLAALCGDRSAAVPTLPMLDADAARALIDIVNGAEPPSRTPAHWHRQVELSAQRTPDATALGTDTRDWTYRELDQASNRLANELAERGVSARDLVGLCLDRSDLAIVAMLAIAKAGAGYVPVDPRLPAKRRSAIAAAVGFRHVVAASEKVPDLPADCDVIVVDPDLTVCAHRSDERPDIDTRDDDPAYVLFTSGSTGTPKGVLVGHGQLAAYLDGVVDRLGLTGEIDSVALSTLGTDLGNTALFPPLMTGGRLRVVAADLSSDAQALAELLTEESYDLIKITPTHLEAVFAVAEDPRKLLPREALVLGGEPFGWGTYNMLKAFPGDYRLYNHYGPSETTVGVLCGQITSPEIAGLASTVPLGKPMRHARVYVLDSERRPVPVGVPGELWISGSSVSLGYLAGTADQKERFLDDPFNQTPGARMYRSGDKVRLLPDHSLEFLGRVDRQIKVRGFRVELGEIEAVMRRHPRVTGSIVAVINASTNMQLVGYLTDVDGSRGPAEWLREFLAESLPEFMVPLHLVALDSFPMTSTGKIDATMLPAPSAYNAGSVSTVEPQTPTEKKVADLMAQLLLLNDVGADQDFFDIGGHSLLATQLIYRLRDEFKVNVNLRNLFEQPVVSELAAFIDERLRDKAEER